MSQATQRGTAIVTVSGKEYTLRLTTNAICDLEDLLSTSAKSVSFQQVAEDAARGRFSAIRALLWAALREHHRDMSVTDVGTWMEEAGGIVGLNKTLKSITTSMTPHPDDAKALGIDRKRPRKAQAKPVNGTGDDSRSRLDVRA